MHRVGLSLLLLASAGCLPAAERRTFALASGDFPLDGKPFQIISGFCCAPAPIPFPEVGNPRASIPAGARWGW
jgi:hypothetical protein